MNTAHKHFGTSYLRYVACCVVLLVTSVNAAEPAAPNAELKRLISELDANDFVRRDAAFRRLAEMGESARTVLDEASENGSVEVRSRAAALIAQLNRTIYVAFASQPTERLDVEHGMWLISQLLDPAVQKQKLLSQLDELAAKVRKKFEPLGEPNRIAPREAVELLRRELFDEMKFHGNEADYQNPDNSSLDRVLATRKGLPIMLSHVVIAVARRLKLPIIGVPMGGRYIVKYDGKQAPEGFPQEDIYLDPFGGKTLDAQSFKELFGDQTEAENSEFTNRQVLLRMLSNLETHLYNRNDVKRATKVLEFKQLLFEHAPPEK